MGFALRKDGYHGNPNVGALGKPDVPSNGRSGASPSSATGSDDASSGQNRKLGVEKHISYPNWIRALVAIGTLALCMGVLIGLIIPNSTTVLLALIGAVMLAVSLPEAERIYRDAHHRQWK